MDDESPPSAGPAAPHRSSNSSSSSSDGSAEDNSVDRFLPPAAEGTVTSPDHPPEPPEAPESEASGGGGGLEGWGDDRWLTVGRRLGASPVQLSIMRLMLVEELSNESIAHRLGRSRMAVDTQIKRLYKKVGVKTRIGLVKRVYESTYRRIFYR